MAKRKRRAFTTEFKAQTVRLVRDSGKSIGAVAGNSIWARRRCGAGCSRWRLMRVGGKPGALTTEEREELGRLRRENQTLSIHRHHLDQGTSR
jgi:transposase